MRSLIAASLIATASLVALPLAAAPATAQIMAAQPVQDQVTLTLTAEDWVKTDTARVSLTVDAGGGNAGSARADVLKAAQAVSDKGEWRVVSFDRQQDAAGLDHWRAALEARLPEAQLGGLADRARQASRAGLQIRVEGVDFTPTLAEQEAVRTRLRETLYRRVTEEMKGLNAAFPGRDFRVGRVDFNAPVMSGGMRRAPVMAMAKMADAAPAEDGGLDVAQKATQTAHVTFSAYAPAAPAGR
ncbi:MULTISPECIES: hypothetical protein [Nitrospirillum]|uniref:Putative secreted protein n=1 Tax=Nitrospirillum amazonense TaxID=28077 RepID=A0A560FQS0_9PROT|nr:hypothetical protein [Nitrospirillum amazonense]MEC4594954.1 hypothetical protein [Nitrospirillum amazonense]TWB23921.1 putative secreted protein [Nitrospirillum amazonense]